MRAPGSLVEDAGDRPAGAAARPSDLNRLRRHALQLLIQYSSRRRSVLGA